MKFKLYTTIILSVACIAVFYFGLCHNKAEAMHINTEIVISIDSTCNNECPESHIKTCFNPVHKFIIELPLKSENNLKKNTSSIVFINIKQNSDLQQDNIIENSSSNNIHFYKISLTQFISTFKILS